MLFFTLVPVAVAVGALAVGTLGTVLATAGSGARDLTLLGSFCGETGALARGTLDEDDDDGVGRD